MTATRPVPAADSPVRRTLDRGLRLRVFLRSLALQASWNHQRMQNLGLLNTLVPWLRGRGRDLQEDRQFCRRYYGFFNTNPYLANFLIGGLLRLEQDRANGEPVTVEQIATFRDSLARAFASFGDQLFWMALRPALFALACLLVVPGKAYAALLLVLGFAIWQLVLRWLALAQGFSLGMDIVELLGRARWHRAIAWARRAGMFLTGLLAGRYVLHIRHEATSLGLPWILTALGIGLVLPFLLRRRLPGEIMMLCGLLPLGIALFAI